METAPVATATEVLPLALLDGYKVRWSRETVARDIVQNFFDEVDDFGQVTIEVDAARGRVEVRGPSLFDLEYLRYIGATTKAARRTAGGFGEGFKVCALVLVRDFHCAVTAGSGAWEIKPFLRAMKLGGELCYEVERHAAGAGHPGSFVRLEGADARLCAAFASAKDLFRHPANPRLRSPIHVDEEAGIGVFTAPDGHLGDIFYRRQHRGRLRFAEGGALTFAFDDRLAENEGDRDRRDLSTPGPMIAAVAQRLPDAVLERLVRHLRAYWQRGGKVLGAILAEATRRGLRLAFPRRWLARSEGAHYLERHAERVGYHLGVRRLAGVGMPTLDERFAAAQAPRPPTAVEAARMAVARELYTLLAGEAPLFPGFRVVEVERNGHDFRRKSCIVPGPVLAASFGDGIATCLARLACGTGVRSRRNADRLTALLEGATLRAGTLGPFEERWDAAAVDPAREETAFEAEDDADANDDDFRLPRVTIAILAPAGFPPAAALTARIRAVCAARRVVPWFLDTPVNGPRDAAQQYARGVPSVWIGGTEIEATRGGRPAFAVRTFAAPDGGRALWPSDDALDQAVAVEAAFGRKSRSQAAAVYQRMGKRTARGKSALTGWLRAHAPDEHQAHVLTLALRDAANSADVSLPTAGAALAQVMAKHDLPALLAEDDEDDEDDLGDCACDALSEACARVGALIAALEARAPGIARAAPAEEIGLGALLAQAEARMRGGSPEGAVFEQTLAIAPAALEVSRWMDAVPLDAICARACLNEALALLGEVAAAGDAAAALEAARERFDAAVAFAIRRHDERDADGHAPPCYTAQTDLCALFGRPAAAPKVPSTAMTAAVRAAWEAATAAGLDEIEATRRCLAAAEAETATAYKAEGAAQPRAEHRAGRVVAGPGDGRADGDGEDPGPEDLGGHPPAHGADALAGAGAHDAAGDDVGGGDGHPQRRRGEDGDGSRGLRREAVDRLEIDDLGAHRLDDAQAARGRAGRHGRRAGDDDPERHLELAHRAGDGAVGDQAHGDDAHRLLRVVGAVGERHEARGEHLQPAEHAGEARRAGPLRDPEDGDHHRERREEAHDGREDQALNDLGEPRHLHGRPCPRAPRRRPPVRPPARATSSRGCRSTT